MDLKCIVLHQIIKEENEKPVLNLSSLLLPITEVTEEFVEKIIKSYSSKNPTYGTFLEKEAYFFQNFASDYLENGDFLEFSSKAMKILEKEIDIPQATGGYVVFVDYSVNNQEYFITMMLDNSTQFSVDDQNLTLRKLQSLDIDKLARANRLNINKWLSQDELYLSFIKGTREVSRYFQKFIGSTDLTSTKENATRLKKALYNYMDVRKFKPERKEDTLQRIKTYTFKQIEEDKDVNLETISTILNEGEPNDFIDFVKENDIEVSGSFRVKYKKDFDFLYRITLKEKGYSLKFDKALIKSKKIVFQNNKIVYPEYFLNIGNIPIFE